MEPKIETLLRSIMYDKKFPPTGRIKAIQVEAAARGTFHSGQTIAILVKAYFESVEQVIDEFLEQILRNAEKLKLTSEEKIWNEIKEGFQKLKSDVASSIPKDVSLEDEGKRMIFENFERESNKILEDAQRKISLRDLNLGQSYSSLHINSDQIGILVAGSVNQSQLDSSVQKIIDKGGEEAKIGETLNSFIQLVNKLNDQHSAEKAQLLDLTKGLIQMIQQPNEEHNKSSMVTILEKIKSVAEISHELQQFVKDYWPLITTGLGLLTG